MDTQLQPSLLADKAVPCTHVEGREVRFRGITACHMAWTSLALNHASRSCQNRRSIAATLNYPGIEPTPHLLSPSEASQPVMSPLVPIPEPL